MTEPEKEAARKRKQPNLFDDDDEDDKPKAPKTRLPSLRGVGAIGKSRGHRGAKKNGK